MRGQKYTVILSKQKLVKRANERFSHSVGHSALRRDQHQIAFLSRRFYDDQLVDIVVDRLKRSAHQKIAFISYGVLSSSETMLYDAHNTSACHTPYAA